MERAARFKWAAVIAAQVLIISGVLWFLGDSLAWRSSVMGAGLVFLLFLVGLVVAPERMPTIIPRVLTGLFGCFIVVYIILLVVAANG